MTNIQINEITKAINSLHPNSALNITTIIISIFAVGASIASLIISFTNTRRQIANSESNTQKQIANSESNTQKQIANSESNTQKQINSSSSNTEKQILNSTNSLNESLNSDLNKRITERILNDRPIFAINSVDPEYITFFMQTRSGMPLTYLNVFIVSSYVDDVKNKPDNFTNAHDLPNMSLDDIYTKEGNKLNFHDGPILPNGNKRQPFSGNVNSGSVLTVYASSREKKQDYYGLRSPENRFIRIYISAKTASNEEVFFVDGIGYSSKYLFNNDSLALKDKNLKELNVAMSTFYQKTSISRFASLAQNLKSANELSNLEIDFSNIFESTTTKHQRIWGNTQH